MQQHTIIANKLLTPTFRERDKRDSNIIKDVKQGKQKDGTNSPWHQ